MTTLRISMLLTLAVGLLVGGTALQASGPSFQPDTRFEGSTLTGWHVLGAADWRAQQGEIIGMPKAPGGGWLVLDRSYQDVAFFTSFRCSAGCQAGVLLRAEKTATGMKGIYVPLTDEDEAPYAVTLDAKGEVVQRAPLRRGGGTVRIAPPPDPEADTDGGAARRRGARDTAVALPVARPDTSLRPGEWNTVEIVLDANIVRAFINGGSSPGGVAEEEAGRYGPVALHATGSGEVRFKAVAYKDLGQKRRAAEKVSSRFRLQRVSDLYYSWGVAAADFNQDDVLDLVSGPYVYFGPDYTEYREIYLAQTKNPSTDYASDAWMQFAADFTGDGWADVLNASFSGENAGATLYVNPQGETRRWDSHRVTTAQQTEIAALADVDNDDEPELVYGAEDAMRYAEPDSTDPTASWTVHTVSDTGYATAHGVGAGDVNGDGRVDILNAYGWWEQPVSGGAEKRWTYHPQAFARASGRTSAGGSVMAVYDVNGDDLNDVVTSLSAHGWGLAWFEQKRDANGTISFVEHMVMDDFGTENAGGVTFSQLHGSAHADVDGDGIEDFIVGKRFWSHLDSHTDPDSYGDPVLYWYRTVRNRKAAGGAELVPELIHNRSGVGSHALAIDLDKDGAMDVATPTRFGTFIFWGRAASTR
ncbi:MAG: FG-GAP-like repeat-containing protein [Vicinamibacteraceae bacterium]